MSNTKSIKDIWAVIELMGHRVTAGKISASDELGGPMLRVDVPEIDDQEAFTQFYGLQTLFSVTPCSKVVACSVARNSRARPLYTYNPDLITREEYMKMIQSGNFDGVVDEAEDDTDDESDPPF